MIITARTFLILVWCNVSETRPDYYAHVHGGVTSNRFKSIYSHHLLSILISLMDRGTKASFRRAGTHENAPFHYIHSYAVKDILDLYQCSDEPPPVPEVIKARSILPNSCKLKSIKKIIKFCFQGEGLGHI